MLTLHLLLLFVLLLPLLGGCVMLTLGRRLGQPLSGYIGTGVAMATFAAGLALTIVWLYGGNGWGFTQAPVIEAVGWLPIAGHPGQRERGFLDLAIYIDSLAIVMTFMVTFVSAAVHLYSLSYMSGDRRYPQFFCFLSFFIFAMLGLIYSGTLLQMLIFWELVGLCSYLLIGFWHERPASRAAAIKAFVTNRVGDVGFIIGLALLVLYVGNTTLPDLWNLLAPIASASSALPKEIITGINAVPPPVIPHNVLSVIGCLLFCGAIGKSAQFPLQTWLPDAMAGPTPVSALIHAATMVAAGVFLLARIFPILTDDARLFITIIGAITIVVGSLCALAQRDLKKALAFSTMAQLGYMVLAIGIGSWAGAMVHLLTHAFFKSLLFLSAGTVIHTMNHESRLEKFGGLFKRLPVAGTTFAIGALAMSGVPFLSGFYSKELILGHAAAWATLANDGGRSAVFQLVLWVPVIAAYLTPLYLTRLFVLTFLGVPRDRSLYRHAGEPGTMSFPLVLLAGMSIVAGYSWFPITGMIKAAETETRASYVARNVNHDFNSGVGSSAGPDLLHIAVDPLAKSWPMRLEHKTVEEGDPAETAGAENRPGINVADKTPSTDEPPAERRTAANPAMTRPMIITDDPPLREADRRVEAGVLRAHLLTGWAPLVGLVVGFAIYFRAFSITDRLARFRPFAGVRHWLASGMYFDDLYNNVFTGSVMILSSVTSLIDARLIDPIINATARTAAAVGRAIAGVDDAGVDGSVRLISGRVQQSRLGTGVNQSGRVRVYVAFALAVLTITVATLVAVAGWSITTR